ncbi:MAG: DUF1553 domain-containing protein [Bacteroidota bacterium]|nr:DUF1553 domain-containing protein [Bacteroidota bacterium]
MTCWFSIERLLAGAVLLAMAGCAGNSGDMLPEVVDYNFHIRPILSDRCYACHGPDSNARQAELRLDEEHYAKHTPLTGGGYAVVPGSVRRSVLFQRITASDLEVRMPPAESNLALTEQEIALIRRWLIQGAEWKPHWSFIPVGNPIVPEVQDSAWPRNEVDRFVLAHLEQEGLAPSRPADRPTILRRVTLDLTGLPPTLDEIDRFLADTTALAYERTVDRLLDSPAFGEHMASDWLDIARYADTHGYQNDRERYSWPWRDWVVEAYNTNLPFDAFGTWQLAGDLLPAATREQILATSFNRNHRQTNEGGSIEEEFRTEYVADRTNTLGTAFLGLTLECARCHDHKYDPITQADYYGLFNFFNDIDESGQTSHFTDSEPVPALSLPDPEDERTIKQLNVRMAASERALDTIRESARTRFEAWRPGQRQLPHEPERGLVLACDFNAMASDRLPCATGPAGRLVFRPALAAGRERNGLTFDGESGVNFAGVGHFRRTDPFSISLWIRPAEATGVLIHRTQAALDAGSRGYELALQNGHLIAQLAHMWPENAVRIRTLNPVPMNRWSHVTVTYDGSSRADGLELYVNGRRAPVRIVRDGLTRNITYENLETHLALAYRFRDTGFRDGIIDQLLIHNRTLAGFEIARLAEQPQTDDGLFEWYLQRHDTAWNEAQNMLRSLRQERNALQSSLPAIMVMRDMATPRDANILMRGQYDVLGPEVAPSAPAAILAFSDSLPPDRYGLAQWLFDADNPLTARVAVNRYWQRYFGTGIVSTPEDFGRQGALPSHPDLLDHLASTFITSGWDVKAMQRLIVTSATYRQSSSGTAGSLQRDPDNRLLARGPRLRLTAEMIRDQALAAGGLLDRTMGGPPVKPYQPEGLWQEKAGIRYVQGTGSDLYRRTLYSYFKRTSPPPALLTFDMPSRSHSVMRRQRTATPQQALVLLNDPQYVEAARHIAQRMLSEPELAQQIILGFRLTTGREPASSELRILQQLYQDQLHFFANDPPAARALLTTGASPVSADHDPIAWAAQTMVAKTLLSFDESLTRY